MVIMYTTALKEEFSRRGGKMGKYQGWLEGRRRWGKWGGGMEKARQDRVNSFVWLAGTISMDSRQ